MRQLCPPSMKCYWIYRLTWLTFLFIIALCLTWSLGYNHCFQQLTRHPHPPRHHHHQQQQNISGCEDELLTVKVIHSGGPKVNSDFASAPNENANVQGEEKDDEDEDDDAIDAVYTWVNGSDEQLLNNLIKYRSQVLVGNNLTLYSYLEGWRYHKKCITLISSPKEAEGKVRSSEGKRRRRRRNAAGINLTHPSSVSYDAISDEDEDEDASVRIKASSTQSDASRIEELGPMNGRTGASESQKAFPSDAASTSHKSKDFSSSSRIRAGGRGGGGGERGRKKRTAGEGSYYYEEIPLAISLDDHRVTPDSGHSYSTSDHKLHFGGSKGKSDDLNSPGENKSQSDSSFNLHFLPQSHQMLTKRVTICQNIHCHKENASLVYLQSAIDLAAIAVEASASSSSSRSTSGHGLWPLFLRIPCDPFDSLDSVNSNLHTSTVTIDDHSLLYIKSSKEHYNRHPHPSPSPSSPSSSSPSFAQPVSPEALKVHLNKLLSEQINVTSAKLQLKQSSDTNNGVNWTPNNNKRPLVLWTFHSVDKQTTSALIFSPNCHLNRVNWLLTQRSKFLRSKFIIQSNVHLVIGDDKLFAQFAQVSSTDVGKNDALDEQMSSKRFSDNGELKYSLRSLVKFAPWIRTVYLVGIKGLNLFLSSCTLDIATSNTQQVYWRHNSRHAITNGQIPNWLRTDHPKLRIVTHEDIFTNKSHLPTFSSPAIESHLHRIPGLSRRFLYINDDILFGGPIYPETFYTRDNGYKVYLTWPVPDCSRGCPSNWVGDGLCDASCNTESCNFDGGDCLKSKSPATSTSTYNFNQAINFKSYQSTWCSVGCPNAWLGDNRCDTSCNSTDCVYDLGDCSNDETLYSKNVKSLHLPSSVNPGGLTFVKINVTFVTGDLKALYINMSNLMTFNNVTSPKVTYINLSSKHLLRAYSLKSDLKMLLLSINEKNLRQNSTQIQIDIQFTAREKSTSADKGTSPASTSKSNELSTAGLNNKVNVTVILSLQITDGGKFNSTFNLQGKKSSLPLLVDDSTAVTSSSQVVANCNSLTQVNGKSVCNNLPVREEANFTSLVKSNIEVTQSNSHLERVTRSAKKKRKKKEREKKKERNSLGASNWPSYFSPSSSSSSSSSSNNMLVNRNVPAQHLQLPAGAIVLTDSYYEVVKRMTRMLRDEQEQNKQMYSTSPAAASRPAHFNLLSSSTSPPVSSKWPSSPSAVLPPSPVVPVPNLHLKNVKQFKYSKVNYSKSTGLFKDEHYILPSPPNRVTFDIWKEQRERKNKKNVTFETTNCTSKYQVNCSFKRRHLLDIYADSLRYVNKLYNKKFINRPRKVPGHMAHLIDRSIMSRMIHDLKDQFDLTSSHRFRSPNDMQFAFSYFYYLMSEKKLFNSSRILQSFDSDQSGSLSGNELHTLMVTVIELPLTKSSVARFATMIQLCSPSTNVSLTHSGQLYSLQVKPDVHLSHLANNCTQLQLNLLRTYNNSPQNAFEVVKNDDLAFVMVTANASKLQSELNNLRRTPKKFICLNDDIDYGQIARSQLAIQEVNLVKQVLNDFYSSFLPHPSPFELPQGEVNSILHVKPYKERVKCAKKVTTLSPPHANSPGEEYLLVNISISTPVILVIFFLIFRLFTKVRVYGPIVRWLTRG